MTSSTPIDICNTALNQLGAGVIQSFEEQSPLAITCSLNYDRCRLGLLRDNPWTFASKRATLPRVADANLPPAAADKFRYVFKLPSDLVRIQRVENDYDYRKEGENLLSRYETAEILYVANITDVKQFDPKFEEALVAKLASDMSYAVTRDANIRNQMYEIYEQRMQEARFCNAIEDIEEVIADVDRRFVDIRFT